MIELQLKWQKKIRQDIEGQKPALCTKAICQSNFCVSRLFLLMLVKIDFLPQGCQCVK
jgi:hypothetical protein